MIDKTPSPAAVTISRMSNPETIWVRLAIENDPAKKEIIEVEMSLADFALALTGRGDAPAKIVRRFTRS